MFNDLLKENITILSQLIKDTVQQNDAVHLRVTLLQASKRKFELPIEFEKLIEMMDKRE
jgi:hypothetical protein